MRSEKVVLFSLIAIGFVILTFVVDWIFIIGAVILIYLNQKELMKKKLLVFNFLYNKNRIHFCPITQK